VSFKIQKQSLNLKKHNNLILFVDSNFEVKGLEDSLLSKNLSLINKMIGLNKKKIKNFFSFDLSLNLKIIIVKVNLKGKNFENIEKLGAKFFEYVKSNSFYETATLNQNIKFFSRKDLSFFDKFIFGIFIKSYQFDVYKTSLEKKLFKLSIQKNFNYNFYLKHNKFRSLVEGISLTKNLVSEPGNILHPDEYTKRISKLKAFGLKVTILDKKRLKKLGMNALLGVGQGSVRGSYLAIVEWNGSNKKQKPLAFVGKGVCFDTGGISLKPAKFMEDMTYDMAGSAVVVGLMKTLALRKAKVNAVGVVGLVENMPDGNAQRPGDIVKSYSGKTIEILNTDAEGRLVLADALTYTEKKYKPKFIVDLATLTGAIIVSLGSEYAGLFSNDDKLSEQLIKSGEKVDEKVWRMPLNENYDKLINSKKADMQNINYVGGAGSTTAAQFLQRFILNKTPWAHLDIAGMAFSKYGGALNSGGATGYGVRLLNQLIEDNYE
jgi:leucyl aminopeptidase